MTSPVITEKSKKFKTSLESFKYSKSRADWPQSRRPTRIKKLKVNADDGAGPAIISSSSNSLRRCEEGAVEPLANTVTKRHVKSSDAPKRKRRRIRGFAPPEVYGHLNFVQDYLDDGLDIMFCGINPGCTSAEVGHHYANPTNHFWKCIHQSGLTDRLLSPSEDFILPQAYQMGLTNLVDRPSAEQAELSNEDMINGVPSLLRKIAKHRPRIVCFLGKGIWQTFLRETTKDNVDLPPSNASAQSLGSSRFFSTTPSGPSTTTHSPYFNQTPSSSKADDGLSAKVELEYAELSQFLATANDERFTSKRKVKQRPIFGWGIQPVKFVHAESEHDIKESVFFVMPSTSARVVSHQLQDKVKLFRALRQCLADVQAVLH